MIKSFKCKETEKIYNRTYSKKFPSSIQRVGLRKLRMLNRSRYINDLRVPPGNKLESLKGDRKGPLIFGVTKIVTDSRYGDTAVGRLFSGRIKRGIPSRREQQWK